MLRWSGQNANQKVGPDKMPTMEKKSRTKCQPRLAFCPVGILSGWHLVLPPQNLPQLQKKSEEGYVLGLTVK